MNFQLKDKHYFITYEYLGEGLTDDQYLLLSQNNRSLGLKSISDRLVLLKGEIDFNIRDQFSFTNIKIPANENEY